MREALSESGDSFGHILPLLVFEVCVLLFYITKEEKDKNL
jgi:hypothetical protein